MDAPVAGRDIDGFQRKRREPEQMSSVPTQDAPGTPLTPGASAGQAGGSKHTLIKNALANAVGGASSALLALCLPFILTRSLSRGEFSAWALALQFATYTALFGLGIQVAVGRHVAFALERGNRLFVSQVLSSAFFVLCGTAVLATAMCVAVALSLHNLYPDWPPGLILSGTQTLLIVGPALAIGLPFTALNGYFVGLQRNEIPAAVNTVSRLLLVAAAVFWGRRLLLMAAAFAAVYGVSYLAQWLIFRRLTEPSSISPRFVTRISLTELAAYCSTLMVWSIAMLMVNGLATALVGRFEFNATGLYSSCINLIIVLGGIQQTLFSPILQHGAAMAARGASHEIDALLKRSTRFCVLLLLIAGSPLLLFGESLIRVWLGQEYAHEGQAILQLLVLGSIIRLSATPYSLLLVATGQHRLTTVSVLGEGLINLLVSVIAGAHFGAVGVAIGVPVGACFGMATVYFYNMPRTRLTCLNRRVWFLGSILAPLLCFTPVGLVVAAARIGLSGPLVVIFGITSMLIAIVASWRYALDDGDRTDIIRIADKLRRLFLKGLGL
jgi:O-antigen/teichoic acid export membrane protein